MAFYTEDSLVKHILKTIPINIVFCSIIAFFVYSFGLAPEGREPNLWQSFVFSQAVGNLCCIFIMTSIRYFKNAKIGIFLFFILLSLVMSAVSGLFVGSMILGIDPRFFIQRYVFFLRLLFGTILFGSVITYFWRSHYKVIETQTLAHDERIKRLSSEKDAAEAHLKLLQAQIEPHFLFNTLSNILTLLDRDPEKGKSMLAGLTRYLRTSLSESRKIMSTVGQEMALIKDYLKIYQVRMGHRLRFRIDVPDHIKEVSLPPMLIQPLVENAIKHGLESKIEGGEIAIRAETEGENLRIEVIDSGLGFHSGRDPGTGLTNIRERLESLYDGNGRLVLEENRPTGVKARIEVPYGADESHHR